MVEIVGRITQAKSDEVGMREIPRCKLVFPVPSSLSVCVNLIPLLSYAALGPVLLSSVPH